MADIGETQTINGLTTKARADLTDLADAYFPFHDQHLGDDFKMSIEEVRDGITASIVTTADNVYSPTHGLTSGSVGKPIGWKADGKPYVWDDTASTHEPVAILQSVVDTDNITAKVFGPVAEIAVSLFASTSSGTKYFWDASASLYKTTPQADSVADIKAVYYIGLKDGDASTAICIVLPWVERNGAIADITDFGAVADGSTDNYTAIAAAIATGRPLIYVPPADDSYAYETAITTLAAGQTLYGAGPASCLEMTAEDTNGIYVYGSGTTNRKADVAIKNLWLKGPAASSTPSAPRTTTANGNGIRAYYCHRLTIEDCYISHFAGDHVRIVGNGLTVIKDNWFSSIYNKRTYGGAWQSEAYSDIFVDEENEQTIVTGNRCHSNAYVHIYLHANNNETILCTDNVCMTLDAQGNPLGAINGQHTDDHVSTYSICAHNLTLNYGNDITPGRQNKFVVSGNVLASGGWTNMYCHINGESYQQYEDSGLRLTCTNNIFYAGGTYNDRSGGSTSMMSAVSFLGSAREVVFSDNLVLDYKGTPFSEAAVQISNYCQNGIVNCTDNVITNSFGAGIRIKSESHLVNVAGNYLHNCGARGYYAIDSVQTKSTSSPITLTSVDTGTNVFTATSHGLNTTNDDNVRVRFTLGSGGAFFTAAGVHVDEQKTFYVTVADANTFTVSETPGGSAIDVTGTFSGTVYMTKLQYIGGHNIADNVVVSHTDQLLSEKMYFTDSDVSVAGDSFTISRGNYHGLSTGDYVVFGSNGTAFQVAGSAVETGTKYYVSSTGDNTFQIKETSGGSVLDITNAGSGTHWYQILRNDGNGYGGIKLNNSYQSSMSAIHGNLVVSQQEYMGTYGAYGYGIIAYTPEAIKITDNYVDGWNYGIATATSVSARAVEDICIADNVVRRCVYPIRNTGTQNGLVLVDDSNVIEPGYLSSRVGYSASLVGAQGSRRGDCVVIPVTVHDNHALTIPASGTDITATSHPFESGDRIQLTGSPPAPFAASTDYWVTDTGTNTITLSATRGGSAIPCTTTGSATAVHQIPAFGTYILGDTFVNKSWADSNDWVDQVCTTAGAVGTAVFAKRYAGIAGETMVTLSDGDETADVGARTFIRTANTSATDFTGFYNGIAGQRVTVFVNDSNTTLKHNGATGTEVPLMLALGDDYVAHSGDVLLFAYDGGSYWREIKHSLFETVNSHATISVKDASTAQTVTASTPAKLTCFTANSFAENMTADAANDKITATHAGEYILTFQASVTGGTGNVIEFFIRSGNPVSETFMGCQAKLGSTGDYSSVSCTGMVDLAVGDDVEVWVESTGTSVTVKHAQLNAFRMG